MKTDFFRQCVDSPVWTFSVIAITRMNFTVGGCVWEMHSHCWKYSGVGSE